MVSHASQSDPWWCHIPTVLAHLRVMISCVAIAAAAPKSEPRDCFLIAAVGTIGGWHCSGSVYTPPTLIWCLHWKANAMMRNPDLLSRFKYLLASQSIFWNVCCCLCPIGIIRTETWSFCFCLFAVWNGCFIYFFIFDDLEKLFHLLGPVIRHHFYWSVNWSHDCTLRLNVKKITKCTLASEQIALDKWGDLKT